MAEDKWDDVPPSSAKAGGEIGERYQAASVSWLCPDFSYKDRFTMWSSL